VVIGTIAMTPNGDPFANVDVRFQGNNVWVFGPNIYQSHDNGRTWRETLSGPILALEPYQREVWAVTGCSAEYTTGCTPRLMVSAVTSNAWSIASPQPRFALSVAAGAAPFVVMEPAWRRLCRAEHRAATRSTRWRRGQPAGTVALYQY
jgi:hypothetical protein